MFTAKVIFTTGVILELKVTQPKQIYHQVHNSILFQKQYDSSRALSLDDSFPSAPSPLLTVILQSIHCESVLQWSSSLALSYSTEVNSHIGKRIGLQYTHQMILFRHQRLHCPIIHNFEKMMIFLLIFFLSVTIE